MPGNEVDQLRLFEGAQPDFSIFSGSSSCVFFHGSYPSHVGTPKVRDMIRSPHRKPLTASPYQKHAVDVPRSAKVMCLDLAPSKEEYRHVAWRLPLALGPEFQPTPRSPRMILRASQAAAPL